MSGRRRAGIRARLRGLRWPSGLATAAAAAAVVLLGASRGDATVAGVVLLVVVPRPATVPAVAGALVASSWRWGTSSLEALAGAQAVLGPAGGVGPTAAAVGSWLAGAALLLALARYDEALTAAAVGAAVSAVVAGPAPGGELPVRVLAGVGVALAAYGLGRARVGAPRLDAALAWLGAAAGVGAVLAVAPDAPRWPPVVRGHEVLEGAVLAVAAALAVHVATALWDGARWRTRGVPPIVRRSRAGVPTRGPSSPR